MIFNKKILLIPVLFALIVLVFENNSENKKFESFVNDFNLKSNSSVNKRRLSNDFLSSELNEFKNKIDILKRIQVEKLSKENTIDYKFIESIIVGKIIEYEEIQSWKKDPRDYMRFRDISLTLNGPKDCKEKINFLLTYLPIIKSDLELAPKQLTFFVPRFQELGLFMAQNSSSIFTDEIESFFEKCEIISEDQKSRILELSNEVLLKLKSYIKFLDQDLPKKKVSSFSIGKKTYNNILKNQFLLDYNDESLWDFGWKEFNNTLIQMEKLSKEIDSTKNVYEVLREIKNEFPNPDSMIYAHQLWVNKSGDHIKNNNLIPIPWKERVFVVPREEYLRKTSYYGNFSISKGLDDEGYFTSQWKINPYEETWDSKTKNEYLVEHDWGVIIVTSPHETYAGHHIQGLYQMHNPRKLRRENGISLFSEGWGLYNEQLMLETDFYPNKKIKLRQLQLRLWRNARVIYDVGMHTGKLSYEDAISLMIEKVGFLRWAAQLEIDSSSSRPGYFIGYFIGMTEILKMREEYKKIKRDHFNISNFHEDLLKIGNMPPSLMREALLNQYQ